MNKYIYLFAILMLFPISEAFAQPVECGCTNCPLFLPDGDADTLFLNVLGVTNDNLASPFQGVCGINLVFNHQYLGDLVLTLISPSGQEVQLVGPADFHGPTDFSTYNIDFIPCSQPPSNQFGLDKFDSEVLTATGFNFTGSYWPAGNPNTGGAALECLEDFDTGPVNGEWAIFIEDNLAIDAGTFLDFELIFCDPTGLSDCALNPCGVVASLDGPGFLCEGSDEDLILDASGSIGETFIWDAADGGTFDGTPSGPIVNILTAGTYFLTVTSPDDDAGSCLETSTFIVPPFSPVPEISITQSGPLNCQNPEITLESNTDLPGTTGVEIWVKDGDIDNGTVSEDLTVSEPGEYTLTVINLLNGCESTETITITNESEFPTAEAQVDGDLSCNATSVIISGDSDTNDVDYNWEGPDGFTSDDQTFEVMESGTYDLTVTNSNNGCTEISSIEVMIDTIKPVFSLVADGALDCANTETTLSFSTDDTIDSFEWTGPNNYSNTVDELPLIDLGGTYTLVVTGTNGCTSSSTVEVMQSADVPDISTVPNGLINCTNQEFALSGSSSTSNVSFEWTGPNGFSSSDADAGMVTDTGTYILTVIAGNGCTIPSEVFIDLDTISPQLTIETPDLLGCTNTMITLAVTTMETNLSYDWTGPNGQAFDIANPEIEGPGTYTLIVTGENGCTNEFSTEVDSDDTMPMVDVNIMPDDIITCNNPEALVINGNDDPSFTYAWTGPNGYTSDSSAPMLDQEGIYEVVVTGANGCTADGSVTAILDTMPPSIDFTSATITCDVTMVSIGVSSTDNIVDYAWTGVNGYTSTVQNPNDISTGGNYTAVITAENGCTNSVTFEVMQSSDTPQGEIEFAEGISLTCNQTSLSLVGTSTTMGATLQWEDPMGNTVDANQIDATMIGTYTLIITGPNGCEQPLTIVVDEDLDGPVVTNNANVDLFCSGDATLAIESNENIVAYEWSGPNAFSSNNATPATGMDGIYTVILTGENGCTSTSSVEVVDQQIPPSIFVDPEQTLVCGQDQLSIGGGSNDNNVTFSWTTNGGSIIGAVDGSRIDVNAQGTYILTVTNTDTGCETSEEIEVGQDMDTPTADIVATETTINCNVTSITLNANDSDNGTGFEFIWGNDGGTDLSGTTTLQPDITEAGTYFITVTNTDNQCTSIASINIESNTVVPNIELSEIELLTCDQTIINIENEANNTANNLVYEWQATQGGNIITDNDLSQIGVDMPGTYTLVLTDTENGCSDDITFMVDQDITMPVISAGDNLTLDCGISSLPLSGSIISGETNVSILWTTTNGTILSGEDTLEPEVGSAAMYTLTVTNMDNGCSDSSEVLIEPNQDQPIVEFEPAETFDCGTSSIILDASASTNGAGITYQWTNDEGNNIFNEDTPNPEVFEPGTYTLTIINTNNNCESFNSITIEADTTAPNLVLASTDQLSCTVEQVSLSASSDLTGLDLQWNAITGNIVSGENDPNPLVNQAGEYELIVTDQSNQCTASATVMVAVDENTPIVEINANTQEITCDTDEITLDASNSSQGNDISILWENTDGNIVSGGDGFTPVVNMPGTYTLTISDDSNGCEVSQSIVITENVTTPEVNINMPDNIDCNNPNITLQAINQGNSDYTYTWTTQDGNILSGENSLTPTLDEGGTYELIAFDINNGCSAPFEITVEKNVASPEVVIGNSFEISCDQEEIFIDGFGSSVGTQFTYSWTDMNGVVISDELELDIDTEGTFTLEITNMETGCNNQASVFVEDIREIPNVEITMPATITCNEPTVTLLANDLNGQNLEYTWEDENGTVLNADPSSNSIDVTVEGDYTLFIIDPTNGCDANLTVNVEANQVLPEIDITPGNNATVDCNNPAINLTGDINGLNINQVLINWTTTNGNFVGGQNTLNPEVNAAGTYTLEIENLLNGCTNTAEVTIMQNEDLPLATLNDPGQLNCEIQSVILSTPIVGNNLEVVWTRDGVVIPLVDTGELLVATPGEYSVTITNLDNGCSSFDIINITEDVDLPVIDAGTDFILQCNIPEVEIQASIDGNETYEIIWDAGNGNITQGEDSLNPTVNEAGMYTLQVRNTNNQCVSTDVVNITVNGNVPTEIVANAQNPICIDDLGSISITGILGGEAPYSFSIDGGASYSNTQQYDQLAPGTYQLAALDANECPVTEEVTINTPPDIAVDLQEEIEILLGDSASITANLSNINVTDIQNIQWSPSTGLSCNDCLSPTTTTTSDILYTLEITLGSGCSVEDQIQLRVDRDLSVFVPNAFSPFNLDGVNDEFYMFAKDNAVTNINTFTIFDRWGEQVFLRENIQPNDASQAWDGKFRTENLPLGVYIYYIDVEFRTGEREILKGDVTITN